MPRSCKTVRSSTRSLFREPSSSAISTSTSPFARSSARIAASTWKSAPKNKTTLSSMRCCAKWRAACAAYDGSQPHTIYFGGGTPSALTEAQLEYLLGGLRERLDLSAAQRVGPRSEPRDDSPSTRRGCSAQLGVTRLSLGVQSWDDALLRRSGASTARRRRRKPIAPARRRVHNINIDLMFAVPGQTLAQWQDTLAKTIALQPEHVSCYCLTYEEDTAYFRKLARRRIPAGRRTRRPTLRDDDGHAHGRRFRPLRDLQLRAPRPRIAAQFRPTGWARTISASARAPSPRAACTAGKTFPTPPNTRAASSPANRD